MVGKVHPINLIINNSLKLKLKSAPTFTPAMNKSKTPNEYGTYFYLE